MGVPLDTRPDASRYSGRASPSEPSMSPRTPRPLTPGGGAGSRRRPMATDPEPSAPTPDRTPSAEERLRADLVVVLISLDTNKSTPIPDKLRSRFVDYKAAHAGWTVGAAAV